MTAPPSSGISSSGSPTRLLLLDTSGPEASLALAETPASGTDPHIVATDTFPGRQASELLLVRLERLLKRAGWTSHSINAMAVVTGPGSFTGVRIGLAAAKGLAEACQVPILGISRLHLLAATAGAQAVSNQAASNQPNPAQPEPLFAALSAGRGEIFLRSPSTDPLHHTSPQEDLLSLAEAHRRIGHATVAVCELSVADLLRDLRLLLLPSPTAADALPLALDRLRRGQIDDPATIEGNYLRRTDLEMLRRVAEQKKR